MKDRISTYPGRVKLIPVAGQANTYDMTRADQPTQEGTPLNKATLLSDETAAALGLGDMDTPNGATVDDALMAIVNKVPESEIITIISFIKNSTVWNVPVGILDNTITVTCVGGGGGGGNGGSTYNSSRYGGGGGGGTSGEIKEMTMQISPGESVNITIGAGGKNTSSSSTIYYGGTTTFGDYLSANGGGGGYIGGQNNSSSSVGGNGDAGYFGDETNIKAEDGERKTSNTLTGTKGGTGGIGAGAGGGGGGGTAKSTSSITALYGGDGGTGANGVVKLTYKMRIYKPRGAV